VGGPVAPLDEPGVGLEPQLHEGAGDASRVGDRVELVRASGLRVDDASHSLEGGFGDAGDVGQFGPGDVAAVVLGGADPSGRLRRVKRERANFIIGHYANLCTRPHRCASLRTICANSGVLSRA